MAAALVRARRARGDPGARSCCPAARTTWSRCSAVLKAGGMIVPLDPAMPAERDRRHPRARPARPVVVDDAFWRARQTEPPPTTGPRRVHPDQAAYVGVHLGHHRQTQGRHRHPPALLAYADDHAEHVLRPAAARLGRPLRVAHAWSFTFDAAWQPLAALLDGHAVHIVGDDVQRDAEALVATIGRLRHRHDRHHPVDVRPAAGRRPAVARCRWRCWRSAARPSAPPAWRSDPRRMRAHRHGGLQLLRPHRDHRRGRRRRHRRTRRALDRAARPRPPWPTCWTPGCGRSPTGWPANCTWPAAS